MLGGEFIVRKIRITRRKLKKLINEAIQEGKYIASQDGVLGDQEKIMQSAAAKVKSLNNDKINNLVFSDNQADRNTGVSLVTSFIDLSPEERKVLEMGTKPFETDHYGYYTSDPKSVFVSSHEREHVPYNRDLMKQKLIEWAEICMEYKNKHGSFEKDPSVPAEDIEKMQNAWYEVLEIQNDPYSFDTGPAGQYRNMKAAAAHWDAICAEVVAEYPHLAEPIEGLIATGWHPKMML